MMDEGMVLSTSYTLTHIFIITTSKASALTPSCHLEKLKHRVPYLESHAQGHKVRTGIPGMWTQAICLHSQSPI